MMFDRNLYYHGASIMKWLEWKCSEFAMKSPIAEETPEKELYTAVKKYLDHLAGENDNTIDFLKRNGWFYHFENDAGMGQLKFHIFSKEQFGLAGKKSILATSPTAAAEILKRQILGKQGRG